MQRQRESESEAEADRRRGRGKNRWDADASPLPPLQVSKRGALRSLTAHYTAHCSLLTTHYKLLTPVSTHWTHSCQALKARSCRVSTLPNCSTGRERSGTHASMHQAEMQVKVQVYLDSSLARHAVRPGPSSGDHLSYRQLPVSKGNQTA